MNNNTYYKIVIIIIFIGLQSTSLFAEWNVVEKKDEMTGDKYAYAYSPGVKPTKKMDFPYGDVESWVLVGCDKDDFWIYFGFTEAPNLQDTEPWDTADGHNETLIRAKFGDEIMKIQLIQKWNAKELRVSKYKKFSVISGIKKHHSMLLELNWYGEGRVYFSYSLRGSAKAIAEIFNKCQLLDSQGKIKLLKSNYEDCLIIKSMNEDYDCTDQKPN